MIEVHTVMTCSDFQHQKRLDGIVFCFVPDIFPNPLKWLFDRIVYFHMVAKSTSAESFSEQDHITVDPVSLDNDVKIKATMWRSPSGSSAWVFTKWLHPSSKCVLTVLAALDHKIWRSCISLSLYTRLHLYSVSILPVVLLHRAQIGQWPQLWKCFR